jgi:N-acetylglucosamine kinase-like BadF-type ATPase
VKDQVERLAPLTAASSSRALIEAVTAISLAPGEDLDDRVMRLNQATIGAAQEGDPLALQLLGSTLRPIARAVACVESQLNIRNFYFVGGFALHTGALFLDLLRDAIVALGGISGRRQADIRRIGALYPVETHDWGLRGVALAAHRKLADCLRR